MVTSPHLPIRTTTTSTPSSISQLLPLLFSAVLFSSWPAPASAYTWSFRSTPQQCSNLTIEVSGNDGVPPYRVLILPFGSTPLPNGVEARRIVDQPFPGNSNSVSFQLKYPENSQFVAVVSDSRGFGTGGTSVAARVTSSDDDSCFDGETMVSPFFVFSIEPPNQIVQCVPTRLWWDPATVEGTPNFLGIIPGGQSFAIPTGEITQVQSQGTGFSWTPSVRGGTTLFIVGGDERGNGTAGSTLNIVSNGINNVRECLNDQSPSSTPGLPAGGSYPTSTDSGGSNGGNDGSDNGGNDNGGGSSGSNTGPIIGGVVGGVGGLALVLFALFFLLRRHNRRHHQHGKGRPINIDDEDDSEEVAEVSSGAGRGSTDGRGHASASVNMNELPRFYQPEPFLVPDPTLASHSQWGGSSVDGDSAGPSGGRPLSGVSFDTRSGTPDLLGGGSAYGGGAGYGAGMSATGSSATGRKGGAPRPLRPINIIQHDDGGSVPMPPPGQGPDVDTIELPPAYSQVTRRQEEEHGQ
ncbi:hypothetical protein AX16_005969 [Volvariella volvacea WC 439]|nr:hypothetical protein AX16_005969 [Volvariella volvacea WC 439]